MTSDYIAFIRELPKSFAQIGAMLPSSPALARALVKPIREATGPISILEVGPGTGPFTRQILKLMGPQDTFTICEINHRFLERLRHNLQRDPHFQRNKDRVFFFEGPVQALPKSSLAHHFDVIVSSLPFSNFTPDTVEEILALFQQLTDDSGTVTFIEYLGVRKFTRVFSTKEGRERADGVDAVIKRWFMKVHNEGQLRTEVSLLNVPPALAIRFDYQGACPSQKRVRYSFKRALLRKAKLVKPRFSRDVESNSLR